MKHLLLAIFLVCAPGVQAQSTPPAFAAIPYQYCALIVDDRLFAFPNRVQLDYGQTAPGAGADPEMTEMAKNIRASSSVIDVLNYLARHGWELVTVTNVPGDASGSSSKYITSETRYLHRRRFITP